MVVKFAFPVANMPIDLSNAQALGAIGCVVIAWHMLRFDFQKNRLALTSVLRFWCGFAFQFPAAAIGEAQLQMGWYVGDCRCQCVVKFP